MENIDWNEIKCNLVKANADKTTSISWLVLFHFLGRYIELRLKYADADADADADANFCCC